jgi:hypothetical protein
VFPCFPTRVDLLHGSIHSVILAGPVENVRLFDEVQAQKRELSETLESGERDAALRGQIRHSISA